MHINVHNNKTAVQYFAATASTYTQPLAATGYTATAVTAGPQTGGYPTMSFSGTSPPQMVALTSGATSSATAISTNQYVQFTLSKSSGTFTATRLEFQVYAAIINRNYIVRTSADSYGANVAAAAGGSTTALVSVTLSGSQYTNLTSLTVRFYGWGDVVGNWIYFTDMKVYTL